MKLAEIVRLVRETLARQGWVWDGERRSFVGPDGRRFPSNGNGAPNGAGK